MHISSRFSGVNGSGSISFTWRWNRGSTKSKNLWGGPISATFGWTWVHSHEGGEDSAEEEAEETEPFLAGVESMVLDEDEWVGFEEEIDDTVDERHVDRDGE